MTTAHLLGTDPPPPATRPLPRHALRRALGTDERTGERTGERTCTFRVGVIFLVVSILSICQRLVPSLD